MNRFIKALKKYYSNEKSVIFLDELFFVARAILLYGLLKECVYYYANYAKKIKSRVYSDVYIFSGAHLFNDIYGAYVESKNVKLVFAEISMKYFLNKLMPQQEVIYYDIRFIKYLTVINFFLKHRSVDIYAAHSMGESNIFVSSHFNVNRFYKCSDSRGYPWYVGKPKKNYIEFLIKKFSRTDIEWYESSAYSCYGVKNFVEKKIQTVAKINIAKIECKAIFLDLTMSYVNFFNINLEKSSTKIRDWLELNYGPNYVNLVKFKRHPRQEYSGINDYLRLLEVERSIPVEYAINSDADIVYIESAASMAVNNLINIFYLLAFENKTDREKCYASIIRELSFVNRTPYWAKLSAVGKPN